MFSYVLCTISFAMRAPSKPRDLPSAKVWNDAIQHDWTRAWNSLSGEMEQAVEVEGTLPRDLVGTLWRNGPGNFDRGGVRFAHVLDGDGLIVRISLDGATNRASFKSRFVRTPSFEAEERADAILGRNVFGTQPEGWLNNVGRVVLKNVANTNIVGLGTGRGGGGKLLALWEAGRPVELDPASMETLGETDLDGVLLSGGMTVTLGAGRGVDAALGFGQAFTAHPRVDRAKGGRLVGFSWQSTLAGGIAAEVLELECRDGADPAARCHAVHRTSAALRAATAPHDFVLTDSRYAFVHNAMEIEIPVRIPNA